MIISSLVWYVSKHLTNSGVCSTLEAIFKQEIVDFVILAELFINFLQDSSTLKKDLISLVFLDIKNSIVAFVSSGFGRYDMSEGSHFYHKKVAFIELYLKIVWW